MEFDVPDVFVEQRGAVLIVTINRPGQRNAVDASVSQAMGEAFDRLDGTPSLAVGIIQGAGGNFSAGLDLKAFARGERAQTGGRGFGGIVLAPPRKPVIAAVEGWAMGGGFEIVLACDLVVAGQGARFGLPEVRRGLAARGGGAFRLPRRLPYAIAMETLLTGDPLDAARAERYGLVNRIVPDGEALEGALRLAQTIAANAPLAVAATKRVVVESADWPADRCFERQGEHFEPVFASEDAQEGATAFRDKRQPVWQGR
jgi:enoyl-CoA hydratase